MSRITVVRTWTKDDSLRITIDTTDDFPGGLEETIHTTLAAYWEALTDTLGVETHDSTDES